MQYKYHIPAVITPVEVWDKLDELELVVRAGGDDAFEEDFFPSVAPSAPPRVAPSTTRARSNTRNIVFLLKRRRPRLGTVSPAPVPTLGSGSFSSNLKCVWPEKDEGAPNVEGWGAGDG